MVADSSTGARGTEPRMSVLASHSGPGSLDRMPERPTGTVTFLFTDVEGSTWLWESHRNAMEPAMARHDALLREAIENADGYVFSTAGDAFSAAFSDALDAVAAAVSAQEAIAAEPWDVGHLRVRMGIHTGVAHERDGDYFGPSVNRTARIMAAGHGGQILLGQATVDLLEGRLPQGFSIVSQGVHRLKDLGSPEHLHELTHTRTPATFPPLRTLDAHLTNLPTELSSFVGRDVELEETVERLRQSRLVTLTGVGGSGKTRLALQTAADLFAEFPDGVWQAALAGLADPDGLAAWVVDALDLGSGRAGVGGEGDRATPLDKLVEFLRPRTALIVLDNCEHLIEPAAELAENLLRSCPRLKILTTSREGLGIRGEYLIQVPSLRLPPAGGPFRVEGKYPDSMELFAERAVAVDAHFVLDDTTAPAVAAICRRVDGMPLAIELAGARVKIMSPQQIADRLTDVFRLLTGGARTAVPRQQTLLATVEWSYDLLNEKERLLFDRLAVFRGGFSLEAAEAIVSGQGLEELEILDLLASLADKSMIQGGTDGRFGLLETLRQFSQVRLTASGTADEWRLRHANYYVAVAAEAQRGTRSSQQVEWFGRLDHDHENLQAALDWAISSGHLEVAGRIADGVWWFWGMRAHADIALSYVRELLLHREELSLETRTGLWTASAYLEFEAGDIPVSLEAGLNAVECARELGRPWELSLALIYLSNTRSHNFGQWAEAHRGYDEGYVLSGQLGDHWGMGWHALNKGWIHRIRGELEEAEEWLRRSRTHFRSGGIHVGLAWATIGLGTVEGRRRDYGSAISHFAEAAELHRTLGSKGGRWFALVTMAQALERLDRLDEALAVLAEAEGLEREMVRNANIEWLRARVLRRSGRRAAALDCLRAGSQADPQYGDIHFETAWLAAEMERFDLAAPLCAFALDFELRDGSTPPAAAMEDRNRLRSLLAEAVDDWDAIEAEWSPKELADVASLLEDTFQTLRAMLEPTR